MSFGKKILEKYGYKEGEALGKNRNGIIEPIKANFKFDNSGLGDKGPVKEDHWWERVFNEASTNINVKAKDGTIGIDLKDKEGVEITNKSYSLKKLMKSNSKLEYGNFLKAATLVANQGEEREIDGHASTNDIEIKPIQVLSDEDLLKACGFRTAHKGARHGLNLSGKLKRIAEQEKALLEKMKTNRSEVFKEPSISPPKTKKSNKRPLIELNSSKDESSDEDELPINLENSQRIVSKARIKKGRKEANHLANIMESIELNKSQSKESIEEKAVQEEVAHTDTPIRKKKKHKSKKDSNELDKIVEEIEKISEEKPKKKKKKSKKRNLLDDDEDMSEPIEPVQENLKAKRAKLDDSLDSSNSEQDIDKINELHHINLQNQKLAKAEDVSTKNFESSTRKKKKKKGKTKASLLPDDNWSLKSKKKMEKYEHKKLKYKLKQEKLLALQKTKSKKGKKRLKREEKKKFAELADNVISEINSVGL